MLELAAHPVFSQQSAEADTTPVFVAGDFNAPSHLDWVNRTRSGTSI